MTTARTASWPRPCILEEKKQKKSFFSGKLKLEPARRRLRRQQGEEGPGVAGYRRRQCGGSRRRRQSRAELRVTGAKKAPPAAVTTSGMLSADICVWSSLFIAGAVTIARYEPAVFIMFMDCLWVLFPGPEHGHEYLDPLLYEKKKNHTPQTPLNHIFCLAVAHRTCFPQPKHLHIHEPTHAHIFTRGAVLQ